MSCLSYYCMIKHPTNANIAGTRTLVKVCKETGVKNVIFCSSVAVLYGFNEILNGTEENMKSPEQFYFSADGETLSHAEQIVLDNNGKIADRVFTKTAILCLQITCTVKSHLSTTLILRPSEYQTKSIQDPYPIFPYTSI